MIHISFCPKDDTTLEGFSTGLMPGTRITGQGRRATRTQALDGGVSLYDAGYTPGDISAQVEVPVSSITDVLNGRLLESQSPNCVLCHPEGCFHVFITELDTSGELSMIFNCWVIAKLNQ